MQPQGSDMQVLRDIVKIWLFVSVILFGGDLLNAQILIKNDQSAGGKINNDRGIIRFKKTGALIDLPSYLGGTVIYESSDAGTEQIVPNITYNKLIFDSKAWLRVDSFTNTTHARTQSLRVLDSFIVRSGELSKIRNNYVEIHSEADVYTNGKIKGRKDVAMVGLYDKQSILGEDSAAFSRLRIDNPFGVDVKGEFEVEDRLELRRGELRNIDGNVRIGNPDINRATDTMGYYEEDGTTYTSNYLKRPLVVRWTESSIENRALFQEYATDLYYKGLGSIHTGGENTSADNSPIATTQNIGELRVENSDSLVLTENMRAIDSIYIATHVHTTEDDTLTLASIHNPVYDLNNHRAEIQGHHRRTGWAEGEEIVLNNPYTKLLFNQTVDRDQLKVLVSSIFPNRYHALPNSEVTKVRRAISLRGYDGNGIEYLNPIEASYHYGWRYQGDYDETANLAFEKLVLMYHQGNGIWQPNQTSVLPPSYNSSQWWGYSHAVTIVDFGDFAIGTETQPYNLAFSGKAFLEGAWRYVPKRMSNELQEYGYLPVPPPDTYPYNLDPNRAFYVRADGQLPDSVVDWVVLEFRKEYAIAGPVKTLLLKTDGSLVDIYGNEQVLFHDDGSFVEYDEAGNPKANDISDAGAALYVILRHRNHSAVISDKPVDFAAGTSMFVDLTIPRNVMGGASQLRPIDRNVADGSLVYGMIAGDINNGFRPDGLINQTDYQAILDLIPSLSMQLLDGYRLEDVNLSGTITTIDFNMIFNNRGRMPLVPIP